MSMTQATEVLFPTSADEAVAQFRDGSGVTVVGGGTIVMPEITYGRLAPTKALVLSQAGLDTLDVSGTTVTLGAGLPVARLAALAQDVKALAECALNVADYEIRRQATAGGTVCAGVGSQPPGDGRWHCVRRRGTGCPSRRPPGHAARARRAGALGRRRRR